MTLSLDSLIIPILIGYIFGSIPFGLLITHFAGMGDIRKIGSGNIGATNVLRTGNKKLAALTLALDLLKGTIPVLICSQIDNFFGLIAGLSAFIGHLFPVWLKFKGGKGVATYIGVLLGMTWQLAIIFCLIWLTIAYLTRYSSLSALTASLFIPVILAVQSHWQTCIIVSIMTILIYIKHHANINRLLKGEETRIGASKS